jgi:putative phosphoesterase
MAGDGPFVGVSVGRPPIVAHPRAVPYPAGVRTYGEGMRLLLTSDTHLPKRARELPGELLERVAEADVVVHAGDWVDVATLDLLEDRSRRLVGVYGNNDGPELRARLPETARAELGGLRFAVVHETGGKQGRERRCAQRYPDVDVLVFGHSHIPWDTTAENGLRLLNPGSPTDRRREPYCTYMTADVADGRLSGVALHRLPRRPTR